jgi:hypothetical protein
LGKSQLPDCRQFENKKRQARLSGLDSAALAPEYCSENLGISKYSKIRFHWFFLFLEKAIEKLCPDGGLMGGMGGYCRGKTKLGCYKNFRREVNRKKIEERHDMTMDAGGGTKQELYRQMKKDPETGEWVLFYHFHS